MWKYLLRKLVLVVPLVWSVVTLTFILVELSPGDISDKFFTPETPPEVREMIVEKYHLDDPAWVRYLAMLRNLATFDFGRSMAQERPVFDLIGDALPNTLLLSIVTLLVLYPVGILVGTLQAVRHNSAFDTSASVGMLVMFSMPAFWLALMLQLAAFYWAGTLTDAVRAGALSKSVADLLTLPSAGMVDAVMYDYMTPAEQLFDRAKHLLMPGVALGIASAGSTARYMRSAVLEVIRQDYIRTARAKGLREPAVILRHAMRNALLPIITLLGLSVPALFSGTVLVEVIFAWPGMGRLIVDAIFTQDTPVIIACFYVSTLLVAAGNLLADVAYAWADPRIRLE
ncbi:MAG: ABC transporter permease [Myxococcota bacterium]